MLALDGMCSWWSRVVHQRKRSADVEVMWLALLAKAETVEEARVAWDVFLSLDGQEHWHCACGKPISELFRAITVTVEP
jgi:hypothetical protein